MKKVRRSKSEIRLFVAMLIVLFCFKTNAQIPTFQWANSYGNTFADEGKAIATDASGNVFAVGEFRSIVDFDPGPTTLTLTSAGVTDIYITKTDGNGNILWAKRFGNSTADYVKDVTLDASGNILITGAFQGNVDFDPGPGVSILSAFGSYDVFVVKLDNNGNYLWAKNMGGSSSDQGMSIVTTAVGEVLTIGEFNGTADFDPSAMTANLTSAGGVDIFVSKLDASGNYIWAHRFGGTGTESGLSIATNSLGVFFTGYFQGTADFDPSVTAFNLNSNGSNDVFICRLNHSGTFNFAINVGGTGADIANSITTDAATAIVITGQFNGTVDFDPTVLTNSLTSTGSSDIFIAKYTSNGSLIWVRKFGGSFADYSYDVVTDNSNNIYTTGTFKGVVDFDPSMASYTTASISNTDDVFIHKLDNNGNFVWVKYFGGDNVDISSSIALDNSNSIYTTGSYQSIVDFDPDAGVNNITAIGSSDAYIHKISPCFAPSSPTVVTPNQIICAGQSATLSAAGTGLLIWYPTVSSTSSLAIGNTFVTPTLSAGTYSYYVEASTCTLSLTRAQITVTVSTCTDVNVHSEIWQAVKIYPNPSNGVYSIESQKNLKATITDILGKKLHEQNLFSGVNTIDISLYEIGIYFMRLNSGADEKVVRLIKD